MLGGDEETCGSDRVPSTHKHDCDWIRVSVSAAVPVSTANVAVGTQKDQLTNATLKLYCS